MSRQAVETREGKPHIRVARTLPEVEALREAWSRWPGHRDSEIDFYLMILRSYPEVLRPHVIALYRDDRPEAILIGRLEQKKFPFRVGYLTLFRPAVRCLDFVYDGLRGDASPENTELLVGEAMDCLRRKEADLAVLEFVRIESSLFRLSQGLPGILGRDSFPPYTGHDSLRVPGSVEEIYKSMSSRRRSEIRRKAKKLVSQITPGMDIVCYRDLAQFERLFRDVEQIAKKTYLRGLGTGFEDNPLVRARLELGARKGWLRAYVLYSGERPLAYWIGMLCGETFHGEYVGYDPEYRLLSPGIFLMLRVIETFCKGDTGDTVREVDFGFGSAEYKAALCNTNWLESSVFIFAPTIRGFGLKLIRAFVCIGERVTKNVLERGGFLRTIKRFWRDRVAMGSDPSSSESRPAEGGKEAHAAD